MVLVCRVRLAALGNSADNVVELNIIGIVGLDVGGDSIQRTLQGFFRGRVHHARLDAIRKCRHHR